MSEEKFAIRFGLGAIKAVGFNMMETAVLRRKEGGNFKDIYDFAERLEAKTINKKSIEALAKAGAFDSINDNRRQIAESFDVISSYANKKKEENESPQMSLFGELEEFNKKPELKKISNWNKSEKLQKEFEAFGFFLNEHPIDDKLSDLKKRGVVFSDKLERDELEDNNLVKMAGVVASSKHRSSARGRFAYLYISDPFGIFEAMVFDEALITSARDILTDGSAVALECLIRKDEGGTRILTRDVKRLDDFINSTPAKDKDFEDIKKQPARRNYNNNNDNSSKPAKKEAAPELVQKPIIEKNTLKQIEVIIKNREAVLAIKSFLSQRVLDAAAEKFTKVFLAVMDGQKISKIELPGKYNLDEFDVKRIKALSGILDVEM
jgi:DNA polymerase III alpha subunit